MKTARRLDNVDTLAREIAQEVAFEAIEAGAAEVEKDGQRWLDLDSAAEMGREWMGICERYAEALGALEHHPQNPRLVRLALPRERRL